MSLFRTVYDLVPNLAEAIIQYHTEHHNNASEKARFYRVTFTKDKIIDSSALITYLEVDEGGILSADQKHVNQGIGYIARPQFSKSLAYQTTTPASSPRSGMGDPLLKSCFSASQSPMEIVALAYCLQDKPITASVLTSALGAQDTTSLTFWCNILTNIHISVGIP